MLCSLENRFNKIQEWKRYLCLQNILPVVVMVGAAVVLAGLEGKITAHVKQTQYINTAQTQT